MSGATLQPSVTSDRSGAKACMPVLFYTRALKVQISSVMNKWGTETISIHRRIS